MTQISAELPTHPLVVATESEPLKVDVSPAPILHCENFSFLNKAVSLAVPQSSCIP